MVELLIAADAPDEREAATRFGGRPLFGANAAFVWPLCASCASHPPMRFLGQIAVPAEDVESGGAALLSLFMCDGEGGCETWEADGGANRVFVISGAEPFEIKSPPEGSGEAAAQTGAFYGAARAVVEGYDDYDAAREVWSAAQGKPQRLVLGRYGGAPYWLQGDQTPVCSSCGEAMAFVAQLEEGPDAASAMNFGGGCAYVFWCGDHAAKMLWQQ